MPKIHQFIFNPFEENTYLVVDEPTNEAIIIDPGMFGQRECDAVDNFIAEHNVKLKAIVNTHLHLDHIFGANYLKDKYGVKLFANDGDRQLGLSFEKQLTRFGIKLLKNVRPVEIDNALNDSDIIKFGESELKVILTPGHSPGGVSLYDEKSGFVFTGDSLFKGSIGRTDLAGGDFAALIQSLTTRLMTLPARTDVFPGHGPSTTIDSELHTNPYF
jgi:glyoxylase-like metal-dependent hydrolase (beta-lactamase superfamily II)